VLQGLLHPRKGSHSDRPGRVVRLEGIIFQNDGSSSIGRLFIRPFAAVDRLVAGVLPSREHPPLAMHAGVHAVLDNDREVVVEQLVGPLYFDVLSGLNWTPLNEFRRRDRGGWDVTVPATAFRGVDEHVVRETVHRLNMIHGRAFVGEDCTAFIERAFGRRLFADSPLLRVFGIGVRVGDPALPLLRPDAVLEARAEHLLHADALRRQEDALAGTDALNGRLWAGRAVVAVVAGTVIGRVLGARGG
jgi:hypothetical protein